jgi:hypothetical protein
MTLIWPMERRVFGEHAICGFGPQNLRIALRNSRREPTILRHERIVEWRATFCTQRRGASPMPGCVNSHKWFHIQECEHDRFDVAASGPGID